MLLDDACNLLELYLMVTNTGNPGVNVFYLGVDIPPGVLPGSLLFSVTHVGVILRSNSFQIIIKVY